MLPMDFRTSALAKHSLGAAGHRAINRLHSCCNLLQLYCCTWQTWAYAATPHQGRAVESHHAKSKPSRREPTGASWRLSSSKKISQARKTCKDHLRWSDGPAAA